MFQSILVDHVRFCKLLLVSHSLDSIHWSIDGTIRILAPAFQETDASDLMLEGFRWSIGSLPARLFALPHFQCMFLRCSHLLAHFLRQSLASDSAYFCFIESPEISLLQGPHSVPNFVLCLEKKPHEEHLPSHGAQCHILPCIEA